MAVVNGVWLCPQCGVIHKAVVLDTGEGDLYVCPSCGDTLGEPERCVCGEYVEEDLCSDCEKFILVLGDYLETLYRDVTDKDATLYQIQELVSIWLDRQN